MYRICSNGRHRHLLFQRALGNGVIGGPALIGGLLLKTRCYFFSELSDPALIRGGAYWRSRRLSDEIRFTGNINTDNKNNSHSFQHFEMTWMV